MERLKNDILQFIQTSETVTQSELVSAFFNLTHSNTPEILNDLIARGEIEPINRGGILIFKIPKRIKVN